MAIVTEGILQHVSGSIGKQITLKKHKTGKTILAKKIQGRKIQASPKQKDNEDLFKWANIYAKAIYYDAAKKKEAGERLNLQGRELFCALVKEQRTELAKKRNLSPAP